MKYQLIIVGSGPAGLTAAIYAGRGKIKTGLITGRDQGGQLMLTTEVENFPGFPDGVLGPDLMDNTLKQAKKFGSQIIDDQIVKITGQAGNFQVKLVSGQNLVSQSLIIASGASAKWLGVPGEKELKGRGISACATCDGFFFKDKTVVVVGGGDVAMEEASYLTKFAAKVIIIHRRNALRATKVMQDRVLTNPKISIVWDSIVEEAIGQAKLEAVKIKNVKTGQVSQLVTDGLFVAIGHKPNTDFVADLVELDSKGYIITSQRLMFEMARLSQSKSFLEPERIASIKSKFDYHYPHSTSVEGIWAAGDVADYRYQQAVTAAGSGCSAALELMEWMQNKLPAPGM